MTILRSMLFVPANQHSLIKKAEKYKANALILDLEDSVALAEKHAARASGAWTFALMSHQPERVNREAKGDGGHRKPRPRGPAGGRGSYVQS